MAIDNTSTNYSDAMQRATERWVADLSCGNPGAMRAISETMAHIGWARGVNVLQRLDHAGVRGPDIWVLFKDECGTNPERFEKRCSKLAAS